MIRNRERNFLGDSAGRHFSSPFLLPSNAAFPDNIPDMLDACLHLYYLNDLYRHTTTRVVSHFINDIEVTGKSEAENKKFKSLLVDDIGIFDRLIECGLDWGCYGNSFWRSHTKFHRALRKIENGTTIMIPLDLYGENDKVTFDLRTMTYNVPAVPGDPKSGRMALPFVDVPSDSPKDVVFLRIPPQEVSIQSDLFSGKHRIVWKLPPALRQAVKNGSRYHIDACPREILEAIRDDKDFLFNEDRVFHFKNPSVAGVTDDGWGLPPTIASFRTLHQMQVYRKIDEAVGLDYIVPLRIISANPGSGLSASVDNLLLYEYAEKFEQMIRHRREDPFAMHALPFPVNYQEAGGNKSLVPKDLIEYQNAEMMDSMGYPVELAKGRLAIEAYPPTLRMFENSFRFIYSGFNKMSQWIANEIMLSAADLSVGDYTVTLKRPTMANDIEERQVLMQLAAGGEISRQRAYASLNIDDPIKEYAKRLDEDLLIQKIQAKKHKDAEREMTIGSGEDLAISMIESEQQAEQEAQAMQSGAASQGGAIPQAPGRSYTPGEIMAEARNLAAQMLQMPENIRAQQLRDMRAVNPQMHAMVKQMMEEMRSQAASQGRAQVAQLVAQPPQ